MSKEHDEILAMHIIAVAVTDKLREIDFGPIEFYEPSEHDKFGTHPGHMVWVDDRYDPVTLKSHVETDEAPFHFSCAWVIQTAREQLAKLSGLIEPIWTDVEKILRGEP